MWDHFDFDGDGKTSLFEKVVGLELLESTSQGEDPAIVGSESDDSELNEYDSDELDVDDIDDDDSGDDDFEDEDEF